METPAPRFQTVEPILAVPDVRETLAYYRDVLGFAHTWEWDDPPTHGGAQVDDIHIQFSLRPGEKPNCDVWFKVSALAELYRRHQVNGAEIVDDLAHRPWGVTEYVVRDLNGYRLRFTGAVTRGGPKPPLPDDFRVEAAPPSPEEFAALRESVGWNSEMQVLGAALFAVTARVGERAIGCAFVTTDGAGFYYVRDVIVHPDWQRQGVGKRLMSAVADYLKTTPPNSLAALFTGSNLVEFYGEFGFRGSQYGLHGMTLAS